MADCKVISIKWNEQEELFKKFNESKRRYDKDRKQKGDKETSCAEYTKKLIKIALNHEEEIF